MEETKKQKKEEIKLVDLSNEDGSIVLENVEMRVPDRDTMNRYLNFVNTDIGRANRALLGYCIRTKKEEIEANDELYLAAVQAAASLIKAGTFKIKN